jgi:hypothetical protein
MNKYDLHDVIELRRTMLLFDDFQEYSSGVSNGCGWTTVTAGSGTAAVGDGLGGLLTLSPTDSTLNREVYVKGSHQLFAFTSPFSFCGEAFIQYTEANTNKANIAFGFMSAVGAQSMQDSTQTNPGYPKASYSGAVIFKIPGSTVWQTSSSVGTVNNQNISTTTAGGSAYVRLRIEVMVLSTTLAEVTYYVNGIPLQISGGRPGTSIIKDQLTITSSIAFAPFVCCKNGSTTPESLIVDYIGCEALRATFTGF